MDLRPPSLIQADELYVVQDTDLSYIKIESSECCKRRVFSRTRELTNYVEEIENIDLCTTDEDSENEEEILYKEIRGNTVIVKKCQSTAVNDIGPVLTIDSDVTDGESDSNSNEEGTVIVRECRSTAVNDIGPLLTVDSDAEWVLQDMIRRICVQETRIKEEPVYASLKRFKANIVNECITIDSDEE